jgi:hypothetical protein
LPPELLALADLLTGSGYKTVPGWMILLPSVVVCPDDTGWGYLISQHAGADYPDQDAFWGPLAKHLGTVGQMTEVAAIVRRDLAQSHRPARRGDSGDTT